jgi:hypothetical protein
MIDDGTGFGWISFVTDSTHADVEVDKAFAGTSLTSGNYVFYPIRQPYGARTVLRCYWAPSGSPSNVDVEKGNLYLGEAWNGTGGNGIGPGTYVMQSRLLPNYNTLKVPGWLASTVNTPVASVDGSNPSNVGYFPGTNSQAGNPICSAGMAGGQWVLYEQASGDYNGRSASPQTYIQALLKYDRNAAGVIFPGAARFMDIPTNVIDNRTGAIPDVTNSPYYSYQNYPGTTYMPTIAASNSVNCWSAYPNTAHAPDPYYVPYILSGDWKWLIGEGNWVFGLTSGAFNPGYVGTGRNLAWMGSQGAATDERGMFWPWYTLGHYTLIMPDRNTSTSSLPSIGWFQKDILEALMDNQHTSTGFDGVYNHNSYPGTIIALIGTSDGGSCPVGATCNPNYLPNNWRALTPGGWGFEGNMGVNMCSWLHEMGMLSANADRFCKWYITGAVTAVTSPELPHPVIITPTYHWTYNNGVAPGSFDWGTSYQEIVSHNDIFTRPSDISFGGGWGRLISGTISFTGTNTVGNTLTFAVPNTGNWFGGGSWYVGGFVYSYDHGKCHIATVIDAWHFTCVVDAVFGTTRYTNTSWNIAGADTNGQLYVPWAKATDPNGLEVAGLLALYRVSPVDGYLNISQMGLLQANEYWPGIPGIGTATSTLTSYNGKLFSPLEWNFAVR